MATFNLTSSVNIDTLTGKGGGDTYNLLGYTLTIDSDTRWANNATAATGPFLNITASAAAGGSLVIDGTKVWLLPYDNGAGVVPAAGDTITGGGGATGELIGVWTAINTTPEAAGAAMPTTGFIKLKDKSATFTDNEALTGTGMTADVNSSTGGYRGWLEVVAQESNNMAFARIGDGLVITGDWFYLDDTTGTPGQILQAPNSGGTNTYIPGVFIETSPGSGEYEMYPAINGANVSGNSPWNNTNITTDERCKFVEAMSSGQLRIGSDGTNNVGYTPSSGCKVRIPNILLHATTSANRTINVVPATSMTTRPEITSTNGGSIQISKALMAWYINSANSPDFVVEDTVVFDQMIVNECFGVATVTRCGNGNYAHNDVDSLQVWDCTGGAELTDNRFGRTGFVSGSDQSAYLLRNSSLVVTRGIYGPRSPITNSASYAIYCQYNNGAVFTDVTVIGSRIECSTSNGVTVNGLIYADNYSGITVTSIAKRAILFSRSNNITLEGISLFPGVADVAPYTSFVYLSGCENVRIKNVATYASPLDCGSTNATGRFIDSAGNNRNIKVQRIYLDNLRSGFWSQTNTDNVWNVDNVQTGGTFQQIYNALNIVARGVGSSWTVIPQTGTYGAHFYDAFDSTTTGLVGLAFNEKTDVEPSASTYTITGGAPQFDGAGTLRMTSLSDAIVYEMPYYIIGHTGFQNVAPTLTGTGTANHDYDYDIDVNDGNGFTGSYQALTGANLSAETIDATLGFKLRIRITVNTAAGSNTLRYISVATTSTTTTQAYQYPLTNYNVTFTGLQTGTVIAVLETGTETLLAKLTETSGTAIYSYSSDDVGDSVDYAILAPGFEYILLDGQTLVEGDTSLSISQQTDFTYDAGETATATFDGVTHRITMDAASTELNLVGLYSDYIDWAVTGTNLKYFFAFSSAGGRVIDSGAGTSIPDYYYLENGWRIAPDEADHTLTVKNGIILVAGGGDPFVDTAGAYTVRINYQQPVQAITVATSGSSFTPADVADAVWDEVLSGHTTAGTTGKKLKDNLTQNNFLGLK